MKLRQPHRAATDGHTLLPAAHTTHQHVLVALGTLPIRTFLRWTFGRSTVIWRIWPAVLFHTAFAALIVSISLRTPFKLGVPNVLLTLLGVVIGFVISYRTASGYDRYWQGRSCWSDIIRTSRAFGRLTWLHVPLRMVPAKKDDHEKPADDIKGKEKDTREVHRLMAEKKMALELLEGYSIALKHHLRGEPGIYYEDLYALVKPLHHHTPKRPSEPIAPLVAEPESVISGGESLQDLLSETPTNPVIPPINGYGGSSSRLRAGRGHHDSLLTLSSDSTLPDERRPLLPSADMPHKGIWSGISGDLIPFSGIVGNVVKWFSHKDKKAGDEERGIAIRDRERDKERQRWTHFKHRPKIAGGGDNVPLQVIRCLSCWLSVLEERGTVPGTTLGNMFNCLNQFEDSLAVLEKILTTPLPFVFSVHIRTVWLYLCALPFQLVDLFGWYTIPGVGIASFIYLGFIATGEEIEQPFGYDENDLDLDMFCNDVIRNDLEHLKHTPCRNAFLISRHEGEEPVAEEFDPIGEHGRIEEVFGYHDRQES